MKSTHTKCQISTKLCRQQLKKLRYRRKRLHHYEAELNPYEQALLDDIEGDIHFLEQLDLDDE